MLPRSCMNSEVSRCEHACRPGFCLRTMVHVLSQMCSAQAGPCECAYLCVCVQAEDILYKMASNALAGAAPDAIKDLQSSCWSASTWKPRPFTRASLLAIFAWFENVAECEHRPLASRRR